MAGADRAWKRSEWREKAELESRLIKNLDFIYTCVCDGRLEETYVLERRVGSGAFGTVYLARHRVLGHCRAVKKVVKAPRGQSEQLQSLIREIHALMDLDHPNIVKLVRYFDEGNDIYLVFELCQGPDLLQRIRANSKLGGVPEEEAASALRQMLQALKCCHRNYMGHFDVKPENFMYESESPDARLKMIDLGLSSGFKRDRKEIRGTAQYMAPEVWMGLYGPEADIWSCGAVLFEMLTGSTLIPLIEPEDEVQKMVHDRSWLRARLRWAKSVGVSDSALDLLASTLRLNRHQRPTARELLWHPFVARSSKTSSFSPSSSSLSPSSTATLGAAWASASASAGAVGAASSAPSAASSASKEIEADLKELEADTDEILQGLPAAFRDFAEEPVLKRAALLVMAHIASYSFQASRPQRLAFEKLDKCADGELSIEAFESYYEKLGRSEPDGLDQAFSGVDVDEDGVITYLEFLSATLPTELRRDERLVRIVFGHLDRGSDGYIDADDLAQAFRHGRDHDHVCQQALEEVCRNSRRLSWPEFFNLVGAEGPRTKEHRRLHEKDRLHRYRQQPKPRSLL